MNIQQLSTFCAVLKEGSMTAAANKLFLTQPAVSQQVKSLEDLLGVQLLIRGVRRVKPTMPGQLLFDYAQQILHLSQQAEVAMKTWSQEISGTLRIGTVNSIGMYLISPIVGLFLKHNSQLKIKLIYRSQAKILNDMKNSEIDLAILPKLEAEVKNEFSNFEEKFLMKDELWLISSTKDSSTPKTIDLHAFTQKPIVTFSGIYSSFKKTLNDRLQEENLITSPVFEANNVGTLKRVIESGLGWGFMPAHSIKKQVRMRRLNRTHVNDLNTSIDICFYTRKVKNIEKIANVFHLAIQGQALV